MPEYDAIALVESIHLLEYWGFILRSGNPQHGDYLWLKVTYDNPRYDAPAYQCRYYGCPYEPKFWMNRELTAGERQAFSRCIRRLADEGLLLPVARYGTRTSHFQLTPEGLKRAIELAPAGDEPLDLEAIGLALAHCKWATPDHLQAVAGFPEGPSGSPMLSKV